MAKNRIGLTIVLEHRSAEHYDCVELQVDLGGTWGPGEMPIFYQLRRGKKVVRELRAPEITKERIPGFFVKKAGTYRVIGHQPNGGTLKTPKITVYEGMLPP